MSFLQKYRIDSKLGEDETMSFRAVDVSTGRAVLLHQLLHGRTPAGKPELASLVFKYLPGSGTPGTEHFVEMGQDEGRVFIVTADVPVCQDLRQWFDLIAASREATNPFGTDLSSKSGWSQPGGYGGDATQAMADPLASGRSAPGRPARGQVPNGFEVVFQSRKRQTNAGPLPEVPRRATVPVPPPPAESSALSDAPAQFSDMDKTALVTPPASPPLRSAGPLSEPAPAVEKTSDDDFAQMFSGLGESAPSPAPPSPAAAPTPPAPPAAPPAKQGPGEFTQMFMRAGKGKADQPAAPPPPPPPVPPRPTAPPPPAADKSASGEFTQMFNTRQAAKSPSAPLPPPPVAAKPSALPEPATEKSDSGGFTQMFSTLQAKQASPPPPAPLPVAAKPPAPPEAPAAPAEKSGGGEFTQMFSTHQAKLGPSAAPPAPPAPPKTVPPTPAPGSKDAGEFTMMFRAGSQPGTKTDPPVSAPSQAPTRPSEGLSSRGLAPEPPPPAESSAAGSFTQMFRTGSHSASGTKSPGIEVPPAPKTDPPLAGPSRPPAPPLGGPAPRGLSAEPPPPPAESSSPGSFTQMFRTGSHAASGTKAPVAPIPAAPTAPGSPLPGAKKGPGELTMLMQGYKAPTATPGGANLDAPKPPSPPPAAEAAKKGPGEFTMMFRQPPPPMAPTPQAAAPPPVVQSPPPAPQGHQPGEYTSIFEIARKPQAPAVPGAAPAGYGFPAAPGAPPPPPAMPGFQAPPPPAAPPMAYPAMPPAPQFQAPPPPAYAMAPPAMPQPTMPQGAPAPKPTIFWVMLVVLGFLFLAALVLVLFFAVKH